MRSHEHRAIGDQAAGGALVNLGGEAAEERLLVTFGDVVALSGDYFSPLGSRGARPADGLFSLAPRPGSAGSAPGTRDEIVCALKVMSVDELSADARFEPGGVFSGYELSDRADRSVVERRVRDRYLSLAASNDDHFVAPGASNVATGSGAPAAPLAYREIHRRALDEACRAGRVGADLSRAMAREAAAQHYLTDAFAAGHLRTPVAEIRAYWHGRYPQFWERLQRRVASDTARALREVSTALRLLPPRLLQARTFAELTRRTSEYPELSLGDLIARAFHDWDNSHGLQVDGKELVFGDGHVDEGMTRDLAVSAARAGLADVELAYELGASGVAPGPGLYGEVRRATGATGSGFRAEQRVPEVSELNPGQNWRAPDVESLWASPMLGTAGPTVGEAIVDMLRPDGEFMRQLSGLGDGLAGSHGILGAPVLGRWLIGHCCRAYHRGFVEPLARDPRQVVAALCHGTGQAVRPDGSAAGARPGSSATSPSASPPDT